MHIGTHKTGTTSIQRILTANDGFFAAAGIHVPLAGRLDRHSGHHNIAWELNEDARFDPRRGTLADTLEEIARERAPRVCLSSEDFEYLHPCRQALRTLADGLATVGYQPIIVAYLRPQAGYIESLYAELVKHGLDQRFDDFFAGAIAAGGVCFNGRWRFTFDYERLVDDFAAVFGAAAIVTRPYEATGRYGVIDDFLGLVGARASDLDRRILVPRARLNTSRSIGEVLLLRAQNAERAGHGTSDVHVEDLRRRRGRFDPIHFAEVRSIVARFNAGNRRVYEKYGTLVPCVSGRDLLSDLAAEFGLNQASRRRKHLIDTMHPAVSNVAPDGLVAVRQRFAIRGWKPRVCAPNFVRATLLEIALFVTAAVAALCSIVCGQQIGSTALVEFGLLSATFALSAFAIIGRYALESLGIITDRRFIVRFCMQLSAFGYGAVAFYACVNAYLDVHVPRLSPDWLSLPGLEAAALTTVIVALVLPAKRRSVRLAEPVAVPEGVYDEWFYLLCGCITLLGLLCHAFTPAWWLDTILDGVFVAVAGWKLNGTRFAALATSGQSV